MNRLQLRRVSLSVGLTVFAGCAALVVVHADAGGHPPSSTGTAAAAKGTDSTATPKRGTPAPTRSAAAAAAAPPPTTRPPTERSTRPSVGPPRRPAAKSSVTPPRARRFIPTQPTAPRRTGGTVYLTFDDGPSIHTPEILKVLTQTHSTATFFQLGSRRALLPAVAQQVTAQGSNVGNHTYDHENLTKLSAAELTAQIRSGPSSRCIRPPFGATNGTVVQAIARAGARQVLWTDDTLDWTRPGARAIHQAGTAPTLRSGSIVLLHDGGGDRSQTVAALPGIITTLQRRGFVVRHVPDC